MTASINASTTAGVVVTSDTSGSLAIQSNGTTIATVSSAGLVMPTGTYMYAPGSVVQVKNATDGVQVTTGSTSFQTTGLSLSITPKFSTSKILAVMTANGYINPASNYMYVTLYRGATNLGDATYGFGSMYGNSGDRTGQVSCSYLDSPTTTSSTTYTVYFRASGGTAYYNIQSTLSTLTLMEIAA